MIMYPKSAIVDTKIGNENYEKVTTRYRTNNYGELDQMVQQG